MKKLKETSKKEDARKIAMFVARLNQYRHEYYNEAKPSVPDAVYDHLFDELRELERKTGINGGLEYLLDGNNEVRIFNNQPEAEVFLLAHGFIREDLEFLYFVEVTDNGLQVDRRER